MIPCRLLYSHVGAIDVGNRPAPEIVRDQYGTTWVLRVYPDDRFYERTECGEATMIPKDPRRKP